MTHTPSHTTFRGPFWAFLAYAMSIAAFGQTFVDGDPTGTLYTEHIGGYLGHGVSFADFNGDGFDDLTFTQFQGNIKAFTGNGSGDFTPVDLNIGNTEGEPKCPLWVDLDNDGDQDLLVTQRLGLNRIYARMPNGLLQMVPEAGGLQGTVLERTYGASVADYDSDGLLDVYLCQYHTPQTNSEPNRLFRGTGGQDLAMSFEEQTAQSGVGNGIKQSFQASWVDVDRDGWLDLHVINDRTFWPDALYRNQGDGTFLDVANEWGIDIGEYSMSTSIADFDKDLDWDIVVTNGANEGNSFLRCAGSPFAAGDSSGVVLDLQYEEVAEQAQILLNNLAWGAVWFDANNDSWLDLFIATGTSLYTDFPIILDQYPNSLNGFFLNEGGTFPLVDASSNVLTDNDVTFCAAVADHNQDGALDLVSHRIGARAKLLNGVPNDNHWIQLTLVPESGNTDAIGARVTAWLDGKPDVRTVMCGSEYMNQNSRRLHFGMGSKVTMDSVVVDWTSGFSSAFNSLPADAHHVLHESLDGDGTAEEGCTYALACNYNPNASNDDGSCDWSCACGPGTLWNQASLTCEATCTADHNGDGSIGSADLIVFLTLFGLSCP